jgi:hypothetical protein
MQITVSYRLLSNKDKKTVCLACIVAFRLDTSEVFNPVTHEGAERPGPQARRPLVGLPGQPPYASRARK